MLTLLIAVALQVLPPQPPGLHLPAPLSPKASEFKNSLGSQMVKAAPTLPADFTIPTGFVITNISVNGGQVALSWTGGIPPFQVEGEPTLSGPWSDVTNLTMARSATFPAEANQFWRVLQNQPIPFSITHTNPQNLEWEAPTLDMGDTLGNFIVRRIPRTSATSVIPPVSTDPGWQECPSGISPCPVSPTPVPSNGLYTATDTTNPSNNPTWGYWYDIKETTANGVTVPYNPVAASPNNNVAPGTLLGLKLMNAATGETIYIHQVATDSLGNIYAAGEFRGASVDLGDGIIRTSHPSGTGQGNAGFLVKFNSSLQMASGFPKILVNPTVSTENAGYGVAIDSNNNVVWAGKMGTDFNFGGGLRTMIGPPGIGRSNIFVVKYDLNGDWVNDAHFGQTTDTVQDYATAVCIDSSDNVIFGGQVGASAGGIDFGGGALPTVGSHDCVIVKFNSSLGYIWANRVGSPSGFQTLISQIGVDALGAVTIVGSFGGTVNFKGTVDGSSHNKTAIYVDIFVVQYAVGNGAFNWANSYGFSPPGYLLNATSVAVDKRAGPQQNDIVVTGTFTGPIDFGGGLRYPLTPCNPSVNTSCASAIFVLRLTSAGSHVWSNPYGGGAQGQQGSTPGQIDSGRGVAINATSGNIAFVGQIVNGYVVVNGVEMHAFSGNGAMLVMMMSPAGDVLWFINPMIGPARVGTLISSAFDSAGRFVIGGTCNGNATVNFGNGPISTGTASTTSFMAIYTP